VSASRGPAGQRRVVIKTRIVRIKAGEISAVRAHLKYMQRDGVTREGAPGELYDKGHERADGKVFAERGKDDRTSSALSWRRRTPLNSPISNPLSAT